MIPYLTIVIPTLNSNKTIKNCIESILDQTFSSFEILIIDGISEDNTLEIIKNFNDFRIKIISEKDDGIYDAMNKGIKLAKGDWVYFLGSDDRLYHQKVLFDIFDDVKNKDVHIIYGNVLIENDAGWAKDGQIYDGKFTLSKLIEQNICHQAIFYKKAVFVKGGDYNTLFNISADWDMNLRLWSKYHFNFNDIIIAVFKGGNSSFNIQSNFSDTEKWIKIVKYFKFKVFTKTFIRYSVNLFQVCLFYWHRKKILKSILFYFIYLFHKLYVRII